MVSLESMMLRLADPKAYYLFYEYFYKAAIGEKTWKDCMETNNKRVGNVTTEAFALLLLSNNYKAWMYEAKQEHGNLLMTEYDTSQTEDIKSIVDVILVDKEFSFSSESSALLRDPTDPRFKEQKRLRVEGLKDFRMLSTTVCREMMLND